MISDILFLSAPVLAYHPKPIDAHSERAHRTGRLDGRPTFWNGRDAGLPVSRAILGRQIFSADGTPDAVRSSGDRPGGGDSGRATAMPIARRAREGRRRQVRPPTLRRSPEYGHGKRPGITPCPSGQKSLVRCPPVRQQLLDPAGRLRRQACQHVAQVRMRIEAIQLG